MFKSAGNLGVLRFFAWLRTFSSGAVLFLLSWTSTTVAALTLQVQAETNALVFVASQTNEWEIRGRTGIASEAETFVLARGAARTRNTFPLRVPRFTNQVDLAFGQFQLIEVNNGKTNAASDWLQVSKVQSSLLNNSAYPTVGSKKGLQVQMLEDALALKIKHAALNVNLASLLSPQPAQNTFSYSVDGEEFHFRRDTMQQLKSQVETLSTNGIIVSLILLVYENPDKAINDLLLHPNYSKAAPNKLSAFNVRSGRGKRATRACFELLARELSNSDGPLAWNYIVGNEVNSHWFWSNMGRVSMEEFSREYEEAVRICYLAVTKYNRNARVFISLEHHWNIRYPGGDEQQAFPGRDFVDYFNKVVVSRGNFSWHIAFHPYPENLFEAATWRDASALDQLHSPRITFRNLEQLPRYLEQAAFLYEGKARRIILSEQGFHSASTNSSSELKQAAAFCYAWRKVEALPAIDSFIYHRHVDHAHEGGLNLGLWTRKTDSIATPDRKKKIYEVFLQADEPGWREDFEFALPIIGAKSWEDIHSESSATRR
jgi:hypothetical protein